MNIKYINCKNINIDTNADTSIDNTDTSTANTGTSIDNTGTSIDNTGTSTDNTGTSTDNTDTSTDNTDTSTANTNTITDSKSNTETNRTTELMNINSEHTSTKVPYIKFKCFEGIDFINYGFSTRLGGTSKGIFSSMNLSFARGDDKNCVSKNFELIADAIGTTPQNMVYAMQTHTTNVLKVGKNECGMGVVRDRDFSDIDGLITNEPGVCLVTSYADCVPLYFIDTKKKCIGLSHAGWRGTVGKIGIETVKMMTQAYDSNPQDIIAFIGPSICIDCYEVSQDVADEFSNAYSKEQMSHILISKSNKKFQLNLHQANKYNLLDAGLKLENIFLTDICTCCNPDLLYSHRASKGQRGGLCGFLEIKE